MEEREEQTNEELRSHLLTNMQNEIIDNPCTRCGRQRKVIRKWKEKVETNFGSAIVWHEETACPNKECQEAVDKELAVQTAKRNKIKADQEQRRADRMKK